MAARLGRWCIPVGKWKETCRPNAKARLADADNSLWIAPPLNGVGRAASPLGPKQRYIPKEVWATRLRVYLLT